MRGGCQPYGEDAEGGGERGSSIAAELASKGGPRRTAYSTTYHKIPTCSACGCRSPLLGWMKMSRLTQGGWLRVNTACRCPAPMIRRASGLP